MEESPAMPSPISFSVTHLCSGEVFQRSSVFQNPQMKARPAEMPIDPSIEAFHKSLPYYCPTPLISLPDVAVELGIGHVFVKDESLRFGLPSFKILGASWAVYRAVCNEIGLPPSVPLQTVGKAAQQLKLKLLTCSAGNWGRAVARMGKYLGIEVVVYMSRNIDKATQDRIRGEGAQVEVVDGSYDDSIAAAINVAEGDGSLLVMDTSWDGFTQIPQWVVDGYSTMLSEADHQIHEACGQTPTVCIVSAGVGSVAQAVVAHYQTKDSGIKNITVEPAAAPCLMESLRNGRIVPLVTSESIMDGMNCGTVSSIAWPVLGAGVFASVAVSDSESHECVQYLQSHDINAGPCGAAPLAAARKLKQEGLIRSDPNAVLVLFSTEGHREYKKPGN
ncbi:hypothetical protein MBLNU459_g4492t2 [Dothideomycetes sp. NU459]